MSAKSEHLPIPLAVRPNPNVIFRRVGDEIVLFHLETDRFYELNGTAARFWELLSAEDNATEVYERMLEEFAVDRVQLTREARVLLTSLRQEGLISTDE